MFNKESFQEGSPNSMGNGFLKGFRAVEGRSELTRKFNLDLMLYKNCSLKGMGRGQEGILFLLLTRTGLIFPYPKWHCLHLGRNKMKAGML